MAYPFNLVRTLVEVATGHFQALDREGRYLFSLTETGAQDIVELDPYRVTIQSL